MVRPDRDWEIDMTNMAKHPSILVICLLKLLVALSLFASCTPVGYEIATISARWTPSPDRLVVNDPLDLLKEDERASLESTVLTGTIDFFAYRDTGGDSSRVILIFRSPSSNPVRFPIPDGRSVIYLQTKHGWETIPHDFPVIDDRSLLIETVSHNGTDVTEAVIELPAGGSTLVGGVNWSELR